MSGETGGQNQGKPAERVAPDDAGGEKSASVTCRCVRPLFPDLAHIFHCSIPRPQGHAGREWRAGGWEEREGFESGRVGNRIRKQAPSPG
jgi:hypothetical protein